MTPEEMKARTKAFALRVIKLVLTLPRNSAGYVIGQTVASLGDQRGRELSGRLLCAIGG